jgi:hypothetical protein
MNSKMAEKLVLAALALVVVLSACWQAQLTFDLGEVEFRCNLRKA